MHDPENPNIVKGALFPDIVSFRKAVRHYAVTRGFEFRDIKTDKTRFIAKCKAEGCPWRIHASRIFDGKTIEVREFMLCLVVILHALSSDYFSLPVDHNCPYVLFMFYRLKCFLLVITVPQPSRGKGSVGDLIPGYPMRWN